MFTGGCPGEAGSRVVSGSESRGEEGDDGALPVRGDDRPHQEGVLLLIELMLVMIPDVIFHCIINTC